MDDQTKKVRIFIYPNFKLNIKTMNLIKLIDTQIINERNKQEPKRNLIEVKKKTYISADACTSSAAEKNISFCHRSKVFSTNIFSNLYYFFFFFLIFWIDVFVRIWRLLILVFSSSSSSSLLVPLSSSLL